MFFIFGFRLFGKVDEVPGLFHVATRFFHVNYVPLVPVGSYVVISQQAGFIGGQFQGVKIPFSFKSLLLAWGRALAIVGVIIALAVALMNRSNTTQILSLITALLAIGAFAFSCKAKVCTHASYERAYQIGQQIGMNEHGLKRIRDIFEGNLPAGGFPVEPIDTYEPSGDVPENQPGAPSPLPVQSTYFVSGRNTQNGQDVCITIWAKTPDDARSQATLKGIAVTAVEAGGL